jgi:hypothetical protein
MANDDITALTQRPASEVLRDTDRNSVGVVRILSDSAGAPGEEREYETGDEALVEAGQAEWVVAPVHSPASGRRLDTDAEREQAPAGGAEVYPPAEPTTPQRRSEARKEGYVEAHTDEGVGEKIAAKRAEVARGSSDSKSGTDAKRQAALGGRGARSGPVTAASDLDADQPTPVDEQAAKEARKGK